MRACWWWCMHNLCHCVVSQSKYLSCRRVLKSIESRCSAHMLASPWLDIKVTKFCCSSCEHLVKEQRIYRHVVVDAWYHVLSTTMRLKSISTQIQSKESNIRWALCEEVRALALLKKDGLFEVGLVCIIDKTCSGIKDLWMLCSDNRIITGWLMLCCQLCSHFSLRGVILGDLGVGKDYHVTTERHASSFHSVWLQTHND